MNITDRLFEEIILNDNPEAEELISGAKMLHPEQCNKLKAHCIAVVITETDIGISWSPLCCGSSPRPEGLLAIGDAAGTITIWKYDSLISQLIFSFTRYDGLHFKTTWKLPFSDRDSIVTHLAWSPWIDLPNPSPFNKLSILAASRNDGTVHLAKILIKTSESDDTLDICEILSNDNMTCELLPQERIPVSKLAWKQRNNDILLAIARNGKLTMSIHSLKGIQNSVSSEIVSCRHENYSPVVGTPPSSLSISITY